MKIDGVEALNAAVLDGLVSGEGLQQIMDAVYGASGLKIVLFDLNSRILMHAMGAPESPMWEQALRRGVIPAGLLDQLGPKSKKIAAMFREGGSAFFEKGEADNMFHLCRPIVANGAPEAISSVSYEDGYQRVLAEAAAELFARLYLYFNRSGGASTACRGSFLEAGFARELLLHGGDMATSLFGELHELHPENVSANFGPGYAVAAFGKSGGQERDLEEAERALSRFVPQSFHLLEGGRILAFLYGLERETLDGDGGVEAQLGRFAQRYGLSCGLSFLFRSLSDRRGFRTQAEQALELCATAPEGQRVYRADTHYQQLLLCGAAKRVGGDILELSDIRRLAAFDEQNQTGYLPALELYLQYGNRLSPAATAMFIDRSTLKYRLQKIGDLLRQDLDDPETAKRLSLGIAVHRLLERLT